MSTTTTAASKLDLRTLALAAILAALLAFGMGMKAERGTVERFQKSGWIYQPTQTSSTVIERGDAAPKVQGQ